jgi:lysophospholipase L1-like esterase
LRKRHVLVLGTTLLALVVGASADHGNAAGPANAGSWVTTSALSLQGADPIVTNDGFDDVTVREVVHTSVGGSRIRVRLSNRFGSIPLVIGAAHVALRSTGAATVGGSDRTLTFGGATSTTIPPGAEEPSDPVNLRFAPLSDLAISIFVPGATGFATWHWSPLRTSYVSPPGDFAAAGQMPTARNVDSVYWLSRVEVQAPAVTNTFVAFGDSITEGFNTTPDANQTWGNDLAERVLGERGTPRLAVATAAINGNRLLHESVGPTGLARFDQDVLGLPGVSEVAIMEGTNDLLFPGAFAPPSETVSAEDVIAALDRLVDRAHAHGVAALGCTLPPFEGARPLGVEEDWQSAEPKRQAVNAWIRGSALFDGVLDFDAALRDPAHPTRLRSEFDSGDHLHPNDAGQAAMASAVDVDLLERLASAH